MKNIQSGKSAQDIIAPGDQWVLHVFSVPERLGSLLSRLGFKRAKKKQKNWWRKFDAQDRDQAKAVSTALQKSGLEKKWQKAAPKPAPQSDLETIRSETAKELRLAQEAFKRAREARAQAEQRAKREAYDRAHVAVGRATGEYRPGDYSRRREPPAP